MRAPVSETFSAGVKKKKTEHALIKQAVDVLTFAPLSCFTVALNFQSLATPMDLNDGRFQDNGGCGYILKPAVLMSTQGDFDPGRSRRSFQTKHLLLKVR